MNIYHSEKKQETGANVNIKTSNIFLRLRAVWSGEDYIGIESNISTNIYMKEKNKQSKQSKIPSYKKIAFHAW